MVVLLIPAVPFLPPYTIPERNPSPDDFFYVRQTGELVTTVAFGDIPAEQQVGNFVFAYLPDATRPWVLWSETRHVGLARVSPDGRLVSFLAGGSEPPLVRVVSREGKVIADIPSAMDHSWDPSCRYVAYERVVHPERVDSTQVYDLKQKESLKVLDGDCEFQWGAWDGCLYVKGENGQVVRYDPNSRETTKTGHYSVDFCDDGKYYFSDSHEGVLDLYQSSSNANLGENWLFLRVFYSGHWKWLGGHFLALYASGPQNPETPDHILDCDSGIRRKSKEMPIALMKDGHSLLTITRYWELKVVDLNSLEVVREESAPSEQNEKPARENDGHAAK